MINKEKISEISKKIDLEISEVLSKYNIEISQISSKFGEGTDISFVVNCDYSPTNDDEFYIPTSDEFHKGEAPLPAFGYIQEDGTLTKVKVLSKKRKKYKIKKEEKFFTVPFTEIYSYD